MTQEQKPTPVRTKLTVITVAEKITLQSGAVKLPFVATNDKGEKHDYATFSKSLFEHIKPGVLDVDLVTEEKGNYINRTVKMVYEDGKPVAGAASAKGWQRDPAEPPDQKRRSYALSYAKDLAVGNVINRDEIISWAQKFDSFLSGQQASGSAAPMQAEKDAAELFPEQTAKAPPRPDPKTPTEFEAWAKELHLTYKDIYDRTQVPYKTAITDIPATVVEIRRKFPEKFEEDIRKGKITKSE